MITEGVYVCSKYKTCRYKLPSSGKKDNCADLTYYYSDSCFKYCPKTDTMSSKHVLITQFQQLMWKHGRKK
jgi:hypothetical protein